MSEVEEKTSGFIDSLGDAARRNPLSAALIGMGVLWLFAGKSTVRVGDVLRSQAWAASQELRGTLFRP